MNDFDNDTQRIVRDIWLVQFYCNGVNFKDLIKLKWSDRSGNFFYLNLGELLQVFSVILKPTPHAT